MAQSNRSVEIGTGLFVLLGFAALGFLTTQLPGSGLHLARAGDSYSIVAMFDNIGGLRVGAPVTMSGVRVGQVTGIKYDPSVYKAAVNIAIDKHYDKIPDDSDASIQTAGLLGANYVSIGPGGSDTYLKTGSELQFTQSAIVLENLINKLFANFAGGGNKDSAGGSGGGSGADNSPDKGSSGGQDTSNAKDAGKSSGGKK
jgi:phospholipid/cholesterol/gamma-HCH transport system substrate-binding protein